MRISSTLSILVLSVVALASCSGVKERPRVPEAYSYAVRTAPEQPVYSRTMSVRPPEPLPASWRSTHDDVQAASPAPHKKAYALVAENITVEKAAARIAKQAKYSLFCQEKIAQSTISIDTSGDLNSVLHALESAAGVQIDVDHDARHIRVLSRASAAE